MITAAIFTEVIVIAAVWDSLNAASATISLLLDSMLILSALKSLCKYVCIGISFSELRKMHLNTSHSNEIQR